MSLREDINLLNRADSAASPPEIEDASNSTHGSTKDLPREIARSSGDVSMSSIVQTSPLELVSPSSPNERSGLSSYSSTDALDVSNIDPSIPDVDQLHDGNVLQELLCTLDQEMSSILPLPPQTKEPEDSPGTLFQDILPCAVETVAQSVLNVIQPSALPPSLSKRLSPVGYFDTGLPLSNQCGSASVQISPMSTQTTQIYAYDESASSVETSRHTSDFQPLRVTSGSSVDQEPTNKTDIQNRDSRPFAPERSENSPSSSTIGFMSIDTPIESGDEDLLQQPSTSTDTKFALLKDAIIQSLEDENDDDEDVNRHHGIELNINSGNYTKASDAKAGFPSSQALGEMPLNQALKKELRCKIQFRQEFGDTASGLGQRYRKPRSRSKSDSCILPYQSKEETELQFKRKERNKKHAKLSRERAKNERLSLQQGIRDLEKMQQDLIAATQSLEVNYNSVENWLATHLRCEHDKRPLRVKSTADSPENPDVDDIFFGPPKPKSISILPYSGLKTSSFLQREKLSTETHKEDMAPAFIKKRSQTFRKNENSSETKNGERKTQIHPQQQDTEKRYTRSRISQEKKDASLKKVSNWLLDQDNSSRTKMNIEHTVPADIGKSQEKRFPLNQEDSALQNIDVEYPSPWEVRGSHHEDGRGRKSPKTPTSLSVSQLPLHLHIRRPRIFVPSSPVSTFPLTSYLTSENTIDTNVGRSAVKINIIPPSWSMSQTNLTTSEKHFNVKSDSTSSSCLKVEIDDSVDSSPISESPIQQLSPPFPIPTPNFRFPVRSQSYPSYLSPSPVSPPNLTSLAISGPQSPPGTLSPVLDRSQHLHDCMSSGDTFSP